MNLTITDAAIGDRPMVGKPDSRFLEQVGEVRLRKLVSDHYDLVAQSPIAFMFPVDYPEEFAAVKKHAADFLIQLCGGPNYYEATRGDAKMLLRHMRFRIDTEGRRVWLECYQRLLPALADEGVEIEVIESFWHYLDSFSTLLLNTES